MRALCHDCVARFKPAVLRCPRCALKVASDGPCGACLREPPAFDQALTAVDFGFPWDGLITRFKFHQQPELARGLGGLLADSIRYAPAPLEPTLALPMPLSAQRLRERGFNQAWELARQLGRALDIEASPHVLGRLRDTPHQVGLSRTQRQANLNDALWVDPAQGARIQGRCVALVDDVMTTGASANAAAHALRLAGAAQVVVWVVARTPRPGELG